VTGDDEDAVKKGNIDAATHRYFQEM